MNEIQTTNNVALEALILRVYPWWEMQRVRQMSFVTKKAEPPPSNAWRHTANLVDHKYRGVTTPNCDTLYSGSWLDLVHGPVLIEVPETDLPYWSIAVMDLNTDNIAVMGSRYKDSNKLLVCGPHFDGPFPSDIAWVKSKTAVMWLLARYLIGTEELVATSEALRRAVTLSQWPASGAEQTSAATPLRTQLIPAIRKSPQNFWEIIKETLKEDAALITYLSTEASLDSQLAWPKEASTWQDLSPDFQEEFSTCFLKVLATITSNKSGNMQTLGQWRYPGSDVGQFGNNAIYRAEVALWGLGALETKEVIYVSSFLDLDGTRLNGDNSYKFTIPPEGIPAEAFWSLTMYEVDPLGGMYFADNPIGRYAIGDRTPGFFKNEDGSIDIWMGHEPPPMPHLAPNWLPAPTGRFTLMLRVYGPTPEFVAAKVLPPSVNRWIFE